MSLTYDRQVGGDHLRLGTVGDDVGPVSSTPVTLTAAEQVDGRVVRCDFDDAGRRFAGSSV